ncbi:keratin-associated protein 13-1-like [Canis lupus dingo]|uniref:Keratin-associated protein n=1 Tax=Canis lupus dingo TaxID=286419 RepID=A0A8C0LLC3_CANLU|nr:keratin-associated protein 13-1-like [Canis lupus dingo]
MSYSCCSGNFSSRSFGGYLRYPSSSCGSSYPSNLVYRTDVCSPSTCQVGSSLYNGCQETCCEPASFQTSCVVSSPCQTSCYRPRTSMLCSPWWTTYPGSVGLGSRSCYSLGYGSQGFRPLGYRVYGFPSLSYGSSVYHPMYFPSRNFCSSSYWPRCRSGFYQLVC